MVMVPQAEQPPTPGSGGRTGNEGGGQDADQALESIKVERNSKGYNYSYRVARKEGESWEEVFRTIDTLESALRRRFGQS
jgi:hypothetical protein